MPLLLAGSRALGANLAAEYVFIVGALVGGWVILLSDMPIYMLFEGRRFWPERWHERFMRGEARRLAYHQQRAGALEEKAAEADKAGNKEEGDKYRLKANEHHLETSHFALDDNRMPKAIAPTRLGNLIGAFEQYPGVKYGLDSVFFWYRIWVSLEKDLRSELDDQQAVVDSALYVTFVLTVSSIICLFYGALEFLRPGALPLLPAWWSLLLVSLSCLVAARMLYSLSLYAQAQYGELFKAMFDQFRGKLDFSDLIDDLAKHQQHYELRLSPYRVKNRAVWRFLMWHRHRSEGVSENRIVQDW